jgi:hypothetical protein
MDKKDLEKMLENINGEEMEKILEKKWKRN